MVMVMARELLEMVKEAISYDEYEFIAVLDGAIDAHKTSDER